MSATAFLRQRRAAAIAYVRSALGSRPKQVAEILEREGYTPAEFGNLERSNDILRIADDIAADKLGEPELDSLEELHVIETGPRANTHSPDVRFDQFEDQIQHPCQETVGVGNMHDGLQAAEALVNVGSPEIEAAIPEEKRATLELNSREAFEQGVRHVTKRVQDAGKKGTEASEDPLAVHATLPPVHPNVKPAKDAEHAPAATEDDTTETRLVREKLDKSRAATADRKPTDPDRTQEGVASTPVDVVSAGKAALKQDAEDEKQEQLAEKSIDSMDRDALVGYAGENGLEIGEVKERDTVANIRKRVKAALEGNNNG